jgi:hypothetical protein
MMNDLLTSLPPGALMMLAAIPLVLVPHHARQVVMLLAIAGSAFSLTAGAGMNARRPTMWRGCPMPARPSPRFMPVIL